MCFQTNNKSPQESTMQTPLQITFNGVDSSDALRQAIEEKAVWLEKYYDRIVGCQVTVERLSQHHQQGNPFNLRIRLAVPGEEIVVDHAGSDHRAQEDAYATVHDAFDKARRRLEDYARRQRGQVKHHVTKGNRI